ncbi:MAG TPA: ATP-binding protein [Mycobacteriales bacterium]|nr:ATP-binding protein [Mycobacteriales bacterium]
MSPSYQQIDLEPTGTAPGEARRVVRQMLLPLVSEDVTDTAELLVSELVTNAITHGAGTITVSIICDDEELSVTVSDDEPTQPLLQPERLMALGGRGMRLVESLAGEWGVKPRIGSPGKDVWFRLP